MVEQELPNLKIGVRFLRPMPNYAGVGKLVKSGVLETFIWGFESLHPYQIWKTNQLGLAPIANRVEPKGLGISASVFRQRTMDGPAVRTASGVEYRVAPKG